MRFKLFSPQFLHVRQSRLFACSLALTMEEDNTFLRAAMSKNIIDVSESAVESPPAKSKKDKITPKTGNNKSGTSKLRSTPVEKMLIGEAMKKFGRDFKAVVAFMTKHSEVLGGELQEYYRKTAGHGDGNLKAKIERVRKIAQKTLDTTR